MYLVILSGGVGSRLWPISRKLHPKPFIKTANGYSILQNTFLQGLDLAPTGIVNVTGIDFLFKVQKEWNDLTDGKVSQRGNPLLARLLEVAAGKLSTIEPEFILEPFGRNTAAAIALASLWIAERKSDDELILVMPSDHLITDQAAFSQAVSDAKVLAQKGRIVTFGISPSTPETGYGYIEFSDTNVKSFKEKPSLATAQQYVASGNYLWNSGMFCFKASVMLDEMAKYCPDIWSAAKVCFKVSNTDDSRSLTIDPKSFASLRDDSIDYAVMEKSDKVSVIACDIGWSDIGNWSAIDEISEKDASGNVVNAQVILEKTTNCYIEGENRVIAAVGVSNLVIVDTPDALLVVDKNHAQDVKNVYNRLAKLGHQSHEVHTTVHRPWGNFSLLGRGEGFMIRRVEIHPKASLSLQSHSYRSEHWVVVAGRAKVLAGDEEKVVETGQSTFIPAGEKHRLANDSNVDVLVVIEIQTGCYVNEDDICRYEESRKEMSGIEDYSGCYKN